MCFVSGTQSTDLSITVINHLFNTQMFVLQMVRDENLKFMKNRDVYNSDYFNFTLSLASVNSVRLHHV